AAVASEIKQLLDDFEANHPSTKLNIISSSVASSIKMMNASGSPKKRRTLRRPSMMNASKNSTTKWKMTATRPSGTPARVAKAGPTSKTNGKMNGFRIIGTMTGSDYS